MEKDQNYIKSLKLQDVPWARLTTTYGRATDFPKYFEQICSDDAAMVANAIAEIEMNVEHQTTLWHATPFTMIFLSRIFRQSIPKTEIGGVHYYLIDHLLTLFIVIAKCCHMGNEMKHAAPLQKFSDMLNEEYLWSEEYNEEKDEIRYKEDPFPDNLFYSFYYYSYQVLLSCRPLLESVEFSDLKEKAEKLRILLV